MIFVHHGPSPRIFLNSAVITGWAKGILCNLVCLFVTQFVSPGLKSAHIYQVKQLLYMAITWQQHGSLNEKLMYTYVPDLVQNNSILCISNFNISIT